MMLFKILFSSKIFDKNTNYYKMIYGVNFQKKKKTLCLGSKSFLFFFLSWRSSLLSGH